MPTAPAAPSPPPPTRAPGGRAVRFESLATAGAVVVGGGGLGWGCFGPGGALASGVPWGGLAGLLAGGAVLTGTVLWQSKRMRVADLVGAAVADLAAGNTAPELLRITRTAAFPAPQWNGLLDRLAGGGALAGEGGSTADTQADRAAVDAGGTLGSAGRGAAFDAVPHGLLVLGHDGRIERTNPAAARLLRRSRSELIGQLLGDLVDDPDLAGRAASVAAGLERRGGSLEIAAGGDGDSRLRATLRPLRGARPQAAKRSEGRGEGRGEGANRSEGRSDRASHLGALVMLEDVTQQRASDRARDLFVAQASHELRAPLNNIQLHAERAIDLGTTSGAEAAGERAQCLNHVNDEVLRLSRLIDEVLSVSQIKAGSLGAARDDVAWGPLLEKVAAEHQAAAARRGQTLELDAEPTLPVLQGDREKLSMLLHNLLGNAVKYGRANGRTVVRATTDEAVLRVDVTDDGPGVAAEERTRIFEPFFRGTWDGGGEPMPEGTGLGLPLAFEVAVLHEGSLCVEPGPGGLGSTFTLTLPLRPGSPRERNELASPADRAASSSVRKAA